MECGLCGNDQQVGQFTCNTFPGVLRGCLTYFRSGGWIILTPITFIEGFSMFLLRHGQSYFNLHFNETRVDPGIKDPELTPLGAQQAAAAAARLADAALCRIIISPYTRALQTAEPILAIHRVPVDIMHEVRERAAYECDVGSPPDLLAARFPHHDFVHLPTRWWNEGVESLEDTVARADAFRARMATRDDSAMTLLVSHWAFILALSGKSTANGEILEYDPASGAPERIDWDY
jgi:glucosyl-3-phosphoglycerate phosphatase